MTELTFLSVLVGSQLLLLLADIREGLSSRSVSSALRGIRPRTLAFLVATIAVYGAIHFGGLALAPGAADMIASTERLAAGLFTATEPAVAHKNWLLAGITVLVFYFGGLCDYLLHRFFSHSRLFWFTHENHHLPKDVSLYMPGICVRPFAVVAVVPILALSLLALILLLAAAGLSAADALPFLLCAVFVQLSINATTHSAWLRRHWWLHRLLRPFGLATPQEHWLHHVASLDGNYGNVTTVWDRVFGTYLDPEVIDARDLQAGLDYDQDFLGTITLGRFKLSAQQRRRFQLDHFSYLETCDAEPESAVPGDLDLASGRTGS